MKRLLLLWICLFLTVPCGARIITVDDDGPADFNNIQAAIDDSNDGDIIEVNVGTYTGDGNRDVDFLGKAITVRSTDPNDPNVVAATIVDCENVARGFYFHSGEDANSVLNGLTITNGYAPGAGGIGCGFGAIPTIANCIITGNSAYVMLGGGISSCDGLITNCIISGNSAHEGGGLANCYGQIVDCLITGNSAHLGGGLSASGGVVTDCIIRENWAQNGGGMAFFEGLMTNCIISGNSASGYGGGIDYSYCRISNCTIIGNSASDGGGLRDCRMGVIRNCIISDNIADVNSQLSSCISPTYSCIQDWAGGGIGNIDSDPCFVESGYWDPNGTPDYPDDDFWVDGDYHLKSEGWRWHSERQVWTWDEVTSRCIDAGNPGSPLGGELLSVPDDPNNEWGENLRINMGAYGGTAEASMSPYDWALLSDVTNDGIVDFVDFAHLADIYTDQDDELPADFDRDGDVDYGDLHLLTEDWLKATIWPH